MQLAATRLLLLGSALLPVVCPQAGGTNGRPLPTVILGGIGNVASSATNFLSNAVETPRNLLINATRATTGYIDSAASKGLELKLRRFLEKFRSRMPVGIPELGIPPLEPLRLDELRLAVDNEEIGKFDLILEELVIRNLSTFVVERARLSLMGPSVAANLTVPQLYAEGRYNISGTFGDTVPLDGAGPFRAIIHDFRLYVYAELGYSRGMYLRALDLDFSVGPVDVQIEQLMGGGEIGRVMSQVFQQLAPQAVEIVKPDVLPVVRDYIANHVNDTIRHLTMRDVFTVILGHNELRDYAHLLTPLA